MRVWEIADRKNVHGLYSRAAKMFRQFNPCGLLAANGDRPSSLVAVVAGMVLVAFLFGSYLLLLMRQYKRCPPNRLLVIFGQTGPGGGLKIIHGGAAFVVPLIQSYAYLSLEPIDVSLSLSTQSGTKRLEFPLPQKFTVAIGTEPELAQTAAARLLGLTVEEIGRRAEEVIGSALARTIDGADRMAGDIGREAFYAKLESEIRSGLKSLGLELVSLKRA